jgi:hypothetical protein
MRTVQSSDKGERGHVDVNAEDIVGSVSKEINDDVTGDKEMDIVGSVLKEINAVTGNKEIDIGEWTPLSPTRKHTELYADLDI